MKDDKSIFLKVDGIETVYKNDGFCAEDTYLNGVKVWIGNDGHFFPCDRYTICEPDVIREDGRSQVVALIKELMNMDPADRSRLFCYCVVVDIITYFSYDEITKKLDAWKKEKETIRVRDEVYSKAQEAKFVITKISVPSGGEDATVNGLKKDGSTVKGLLLCNLKKTGVHVDDLDAYLEV